MTLEGFEPAISADLHLLNSIRGTVVPASSIVDEFQYMKTKENVSGGETSFD